MLLTILDEDSHQDLKLDEEEICSPTYLLTIFVCRMQINLILKITFDFKCICVIYIFLLYW